MDKPIVENKNRKVVFISMIDGTDDDVISLRDALETAGVHHDFNLLISGRPIQTVDPLELIESLSHIHNVSEDGDPHETGITRTGRFRDLLRYTDMLASQVQTYIQTNEKNVESLMSQIIQLRTDVSLEPTFTHLIQSSAIANIAKTVDRIQQIVPSEGEHM